MYWPGSVNIDYAFNNSIVQKYTPVNCYCVFSFHDVPIIPGSGHGLMVSVPKSRVNCLTNLMGLSNWNEPFKLCYNFEIRFTVLCHYFFPFPLFTCNFCHGFRFYLDKTYLILLVDNDINDLVIINARNFYWSHCITTEKNICFLLKMFLLYLSVTQISLISFSLVQWRRIDNSFS